MTDGNAGWAHTVLGWFVVRDSDRDAETAREDVAPTAAQVEPIGELPAAPEGVVDFEAVFAAFGIDTEARDRLAKGKGLLKALPDGTDPMVKRQIVEASLRAFGVPFEQIIESACEEVQALDAYQRKGGAALQAFCEEAERRIAGFDQEIKSTRAAMEKEVADQKRILESCNRMKLEIQQVLEFFGPEAVGRVVRDSPKLIDPSAPGTTRGAS